MTVIDSPALGVGPTTRSSMQMLASIPSISILAFWSHLPIRRRLRIGSTDKTLAVFWAEGVPKAQPATADHPNGEKITIADDITTISGNISIHRTSQVGYRCARLCCFRSSRNHTIAKAGKRTANSNGTAARYVLVNEETKLSPTVNSSGTLTKARNISPTAIFCHRPGRGVVGCCACISAMLSATFLSRRSEIACNRASMRLVASASSFP